MDVSRPNAPFDLGSRSAFMPHTDDVEVVKTLRKQPVFSQECQQISAILSVIYVRY